MPPSSSAIDKALLFYFPAACDKFYTSLCVYWAQREVSHLKRFLLVLAALLMWLSSSTGAWAEEPEPDWLELLIQAAVDGDREAGLAAAEGWNADESRTPLDYDELFLLSKLITWEAGSQWLTDELRMGIGEVALNRVASPEYPDTLEEVVYQYAQYTGADTPAFRYYFFPTRPCVEIALRLLLGERILQPQVVFAGHAIQGKIHSVFRDLHYGSIYFCESRHPELYETPEPEEVSGLAGIAEKLRESILQQK